MGAIVAVTRKTRTAEGVRPPAISKHLMGPVLFGVLLGVAFTTAATPSSNVAYRRIDVQDADHDVGVSSRQAGHIPRRYAGTGMLHSVPRFPAYMRRGRELRDLPAAG